MPTATARAIRSRTAFPTASLIHCASTRRWNSKSTRRCRVAGRCARTIELPSCRATTKVRSATTTVRAIRTSARCSTSPQGDFNLLGQQFVPGVLNTDVRHLANGYVSYTFSGNHAKGLTMGSSVHYQTGVPINNLFAHPAYQNAGEIPFCADNTTNCTSARGSLGRTKNWGSVDYHVDYPIRITEGTRLRMGADLFNITNNKTQLRVEQRAQRSCRRVRTLTLASRRASVLPVCSATPTRATSVRSTPGSAQDSNSRSTWNSLNKEGHCGPPFFYPVM